MDRELERIKGLVSNSPYKKCSLIFDGTTWYGEVVGFLLKFWKSNAEVVTLAIAYFHSDSCVAAMNLAGK